MYMTHSGPGTAYSTGVSEMGPFPLTGNLVTSKLTAKSTWANN